MEWREIFQYRKRIISIIPKFLISAASSRHYHHRRYRRRHRLYIHPVYELHMEKSEKLGIRSCVDVCLCVCSRNGEIGLHNMMNGINNLFICFDFLLQPFAEAVAMKSTDTATSLASASKSFISNGLHCCFFFTVFFLFVVLIFFLLKLLFRRT